MSRIVVVGSANIDMVVRTDRIPNAGETVMGGEFVMVPGGKGANQAVCAAKLGADVELVARVGRDVFGRTSLDGFRSVGVGTEFVIEDEGHPTGVALISVDTHGENAIVVAPGANAALTPEDVDRASGAIKGADVVVLQLEIPMATVAHTAEMARSAGVMVVLNPAPIQPLPAELLRSVDVLVPNEHEAAGLLGLVGALDAPAAAERIRSLGVGSVVITLGADGACVASEAQSSHVEAFKVQAVDTTAAGDAFTASLACGLAEGMDIMSAARFAARVSAISVTRMGAQPSMPTRREVESYEFGN